MIRIPADEIDENFDEDAWNKKVYGADIIVVDKRIHLQPLPTTVTVHNTSMSLLSVTVS